MHLWTKKIKQPFGSKKSRNLSGHKESTLPLRTKICQAKNHATSWDKKTHATSVDKKKITQALWIKNNATSWDKKNHATYWYKKKSRNFLGQKNHATSWTKKFLDLSGQKIDAQNCSKWHQLCPNGSKYVQMDPNCSKLFQKGLNGSQWDN